MHQQKLTISGVGIQVEDHDGAEEAIIFLHYGGANLRMWDPVLPFFSQDYRCVALDLRGHGLSDAPATGYHIDDMARDVIGVADALGIDQAHVIGSSIGAEVGLSMAANYPNRMLSLVADGALCSEYGPFGVREPEDLSEDEEVKLQLEKRKDAPERTYESREAYLQKSSEFYKECGFWNPTVEAMLSYGAVENEEGEIVNAWRKRASDIYMEIYFDLRLEEYYERVTCPMIMLPEEEDVEDEKLFDIMTRLSRLPKQCEIVQVPGLIHPFGWMLNPEPVSRAVLDFYKRLR
ncbi:alpha/beta fold hydrolase [Candidatus Bipolaricaulota bacterium]